MCATASSKDDGVEPERLRDASLQILHPLQAGAAQPATATQHRLYLLEHGGIKEKETKEKVVVMLSRLALLSRPQLPNTDSISWNMEELSKMRKRKRSRRPVQAGTAHPPTATQHRLYLLEHGGSKQNEKKEKVVVILSRLPLLSRPLLPNTDSISWT